MAIYAYQALDQRRTLLKGTLAADTPRQAREVLRSRGLRVQAIEEGGAARAAAPRWWMRRSVSAQRVLTALREVVTLLSAGIPLLEALRTVAEQQRGAFRTALLALHERVAAGSGLAEAMAAQPTIFDDLCIHMVEVGENSGTLESVLDEWVEFKERAAALKDRVLTALLYPAFVTVVGFGVAIFLMTYVIPMLLTNLVDAGQTIPWPTRVVKAVSEFLAEYGVGMALVAVVAMGVFVASVRRPRGRRTWQGLLLRLPVFGLMARKQAIARCAMIIATLMKSGIEFVRAVEVTARSVRNVWLRDALLQCTQAVGAGQEIGQSLARTRFFPPLVVQIFSVGQESGRMEEMLERLARDYDRQVARASERLTAILEPVLILGLAVFVGFLLLATILPILEAGNIL